MKPPHLTRLLALETPERVSDGAGGYSQSWTELGQHWAEVSARTGRERAVEGAQASLTGYRIVVRGAPVGSDARPRPDQRFREGARIFRILAVAELDHAGRYLTCYAEEEILA
ncbi:MAG: head-tail adaptor protein [Paracoccaceae bacterium]